MLPKTLTIFKESTQDKQWSGTDAIRIKQLKVENN